MNIKIKTNNVPRQTVYGCQLPEKWRSKFGYMSDEEYETHTFVIYKKWVYDISEFMRIPNGAFGINNLADNDSDFIDLNKWHGYMSDSFFSGVLIRFVDECDDEYVVMGTYYG